MFQVVSKLSKIIYSLQQQQKKQLFAIYWKRFHEKEATVNTSIYIVKFFLIILLFLSLRTIRRYVTQLKNSFQKKNIFPSTASYNKNNRAYLTFGRLNREFKINLNITKHQKK